MEIHIHGLVLPLVLGEYPELYLTSLENEQIRKNILNTKGMNKKIYVNIDEYENAQPENIKEILKQIRRTVKTAAPNAIEQISYGMPSFRVNKTLVYYAAFKNHIGFFPTPEGIDAFKEELKPFSVSKGTIRFHLEKPIPYDLISKIVKKRVEQDAKAK